MCMVTYPALKTKQGPSDHLQHNLNHFLKPDLRWWVDGWDSSKSRAHEHATNRPCCCASAYLCVQIVFGLPSSDGG
ncbi:hypothetical protein JTE90_000641 [Oedothorax gibbosus]|uniref:Uncharacterized protein n=1 Tax=Oedothorax gibbosus TaxID=931172 RepID=A0AAV6VV83_9ARAC|nr:hypothetical protein JTE90_000641 [Oedothorax gibbosus]